MEKLTAEISKLFETNPNEMNEIYKSLELLARKNIIERSIASWQILKDKRREGSVRMKAHRENYKIDEDAIAAWVELETAAGYPKKSTFATAEDMDYAEAYVKVFKLKKYAEKKQDAGLLEKVEAFEKIISAYKKENDCKRAVSLN